MTKSTWRFCNFCLQTVNIYLLSRVKKKEVVTFLTCFHGENKLEWLLHLALGRLWVAGLGIAAFHEPRCWASLGKCTTVWLSCICTMAPWHTCMEREWERCVLGKRWEGKGDGRSERVILKGQGSWENAWVRVADFPPKEKIQEELLHQYLRPLLLKIMAYVRGRIA